MWVSWDRDPEFLSETHGIIDIRLLGARWVVGSMSVDFDLKFRMPRNLRAGGVWLAGSRTKFVPFPAQAGDKRSA
jgi:hypothetical protein